MRKVYRLNRQMNTARIILTGKTGNEVVFPFTNGNVITNTPARISLENEYDQMLLEESDMYKGGIITLEQVIKSDEEKAEESKKSGMKKVEDVKSVVEAINYVAENFGEKVTTAKQAKEVAEANGVDFVNLKVGKK